MSDFAKQYEGLEASFKKQVKRDRKKLKCDDIVYLPQFVRPKHRADYIFIAMEPNLKKTWAKPLNRKGGELAVKNGFRNYMPCRPSGRILHYCAKKYLCQGKQTYHITDMSKGAMMMKQADADRKERWEEWFPLLEKELKLVAKKDAVVFAIGKKVKRFLYKKQVQGRFQYKLEYLLHPSDSNKKHRKEFVAVRKSEFNKFKQTVTEKSLKDFVISMLSKEDIRWAIKAKMSDSIKMLMFCFKIRFEECR